MAKKEKEVKTNAVRIVAANKISYQLHTYEALWGFIRFRTRAPVTGVVA